MSIRDISNFRTQIPTLIEIVEKLPKNKEKFLKSIDECKDKIDGSVNKIRGNLVISRTDIQKMGDEIQVLLDTQMKLLTKEQEKQKLAEEAERLKRLAEEMERERLRKEKEEQERVAAEEEARRLREMEQLRKAEAEAEEKRQEAARIQAEKDDANKKLQTQRAAELKRQKEEADLLEQERGVAVDVPRGGKMDWTSLRAKIATQGMRNSNVLAIAPTATISNITNTSPCIEPTYKNLFVKSNLSGEFIVLNPFLVKDLKTRGLWDQDMIDNLKYFDGEVKDIDRIPADLKAKYLTAFDIDAKWIVDAAARRQKWIDQAQSVNLWIKTPDLKTLSHMYRHAWHAGGARDAVLARQARRTHGAHQARSACQAVRALSTRNTRNPVEAGRPRRPRRTRRTRDAIHAVGTLRTWGPRWARGSHQAR